MKTLFTIIGTVAIVVLALTSEGLAALPVDIFKIWKAVMTANC